MRSYSEWILVCMLGCMITKPSHAKLADRGRLVKSRKENVSISNIINSRVPGKDTKSFKRNDLPIEGPRYHGRGRQDAYESHLRKRRDDSSGSTEDFGRELAQLTGCCSDYSSYSADDLCSLYGENCNTGCEPSHDSGDGDCEMAGLSFIGISFSVNTANGNPASYQLNDQFPMENLIDRNYDYVMSMDEDGWLVGGGYKSFDYSGKMPYIDSSHTELLRIGALDAAYGGTTIAQVYAAMSSISFPPFSVFPEYVKGGGGGGSGDDDDTVPSGDVTLIVSIVEEYGDNSNYSLYEQFLSDLFNAMDAVNGGPCMDDHDTDPHVSMARGVKFKSSYHQEQYFYSVNLEVAVWQAMYPNGVIIGSSTKVNFPPENYNKNRRSVRYGSLYFFFDRANITMPFSPNRNLYDSETYYATLAQGDTSVFYSGVKKIGFNYAGSGSKNNKYYEHNPYAWNAAMAMHDMTDGWDLPPNCDMEGETFLGIPLSRKSASKLQSTGTFQDQFDFEYLVDRNFTYIKKFGTNHGWLVGESVGNAAGSIVDKDTSHIPIFYTGTTNPKMGGISLADIIKVVKLIDFGTLYIKPAFLFQDDNGAIKLQFEADASSALGYLYDNLCKMLGLSWNYESPSNKYGVYTNCAMHAAGDRAAYGCGPGNGNKGGFCPQLTVGYRVNFQSEDHAAAFFERGNTYVDYWRSLYPKGVAVGTDSFCPKGGCLGLFLNRYDLYEVFKPNLGGSWVEYNGGTFAPTISPAPTLKGGCNNKYNQHLDRCAKRFSSHHMKASSVAWNSLGGFGQLSIFLVTFMAVTLSISIFLARARKRRRKGESYYDFMIRDWNRRSGRGRKKKKSSRNLNKDLGQDLLGDRPPYDKSRSRSKSRSRRSEDSSSRRSSSRHLPSGDDYHSRSSSSRHVDTHSSGLVPIDSRSSRRSMERDIGMGSEHRSSSRARTRDESSSRHRSSSRRSSKHRDSSKSRADERSSRRSSSRSESRRESSVSRAESVPKSQQRRQLV